MDTPKHLKMRDLSGIGKIHGSRLHFYRVRSGAKAIWEWAVPATEEKKITLVNQGSYAIASQDEACLIGAYELEDSLVMVVFDEANNSALFNVDRLTNSKILQRHILEHFPGNSPLTFKIQNPSQLTTSNDLYSSEKSHLAEMQARLDIIQKTIEQVVRCLGLQRPITSTTFYFQNKPCRICVYHPNSTNISTGTFTQFGIHHLQGKTLGEKSNDQHYCQEQLTWAIRHLSGLRHPPMVNMDKLWGNLTPKHIQHMTGDSWRFKQLPLEKVYNNKELERRRYLYFLYNAAFTLAKITIKQSNCLSLLPYLEVAKAEQIITQAFLNSKCGHQLLSLTEEEKIHQPIQKIATLLRRAIYHRSGFYHRLQALLATDMNSRHTSPRHSINFNQFNAPTITQMIDETTANSPSSTCTDQAHISVNSLSH